MHMEFNVLRIKLLLDFQGHVGLALGGSGTPLYMSGAGRGRQ